MKKTSKFIKIALGFIVLAPATLLAAEILPLSPLVQTDKALFNGGKIEIKLPSKQQIQQQNLQKLLQSRALEQKFKNGASSFQVGGNSGGGGDEDGIEFQKTAIEAFQDLKEKLPLMYQSLESVGIEEIISSMKVVVVNDALDVQAKAYMQNSVAVNFPETITVVVNRPRWMGITDRVKRKGIAMHEVLSLKKLETTGLYAISAKYLAAMGADEKQLETSLKVDRNLQLRALSPEDSMFDVLQKSFDESRQNVSFEEMDALSKNRNQVCTWMTYYSATHSVLGPFRGRFSFLHSKDGQAGVVVSIYKNSNFLIQGMVRTSPAEFVSSTTDTDIDALIKRVTRVRKNNGNITVLWSESSLDVQTKKEIVTTSYGSCSAGE